MSIHPNPMGREYSPAEWAAAKRVGITTNSRAVVAGEVVTTPSGPLLYATGPWHPDNARAQTLKAMQAAKDWQTVEAAMRREWKKELPDDHPTA